MTAVKSRRPALPPALTLSPLRPSSHASPFAPGVNSVRFFPSFISLCSKGVPSGYSKSVCVRMPSEKSEHTMQVSQTTPDEHPPTPPPCRWSARITLRTSTKFQHVDAASVVMTYVLFRSPSLCYPRIGLVVNIIYIRRYFDQINILSYVRPGLYCFEVRLELYDGDGPSSSLGRLPCLRLTPPRHRKPNGQLSPDYPPLPSSARLAPLVTSSAVLFLPRWSETSVSAASFILKSEI